jgi:hypothetical protein
MHSQSAAFRCRCRFWFPVAKCVKAVFGSNVVHLHTVEGGRFVDDIWSFPDPYNAAYTVRDGVYYSVLNTEIGPIGSFPEQADDLFVTNTLSILSEMHPVGTYGPADRAVHAVLKITGTVREMNHVAWLWTSPSGRMAIRTHVAVGNADLFYASEPMQAFFEPGIWRVSPFLNSRFCGEVTFRVKCSGYRGTGAGFSLRR